jgi:hypothetical protein
MNTPTKAQTTVRSVRMPASVLAEVSKTAERNERSVNREIVFHLKRSLSIEAEKSAA